MKRGIDMNKKIKIEVEIDETTEEEPNVDIKPEEGTS